jgi:hypothetical protein
VPFAIPMVATIIVPAQTLVPGANGLARNDDVLHRNIGFFKVGQQRT